MRVDYYQFWKEGKFAHGKSIAEDSNLQQQSTQDLHAKMTRWEELKNGEVAFNDWIVTKEGDLVNEEEEYVIEKERLTEPDWISHLLSKAWIDFDSFIRAYWFALERNNITSLDVRIFNGGFGPF